MTTIISATNRTDSNSLHIARYYQKKLKEKGLESNLLSLKDLPIYNVNNSSFEDGEGEFKALQEIIFNSDKYIFIIPEYNGSFPGILKLFIDACNFPKSFKGKKCALVGIASGKYGNIRGVEHFTGICHYLGMHVQPLKIHITDVNNQLNGEFEIFQEDTLKFSNQQMEEFIEF